MTSKGSTNRMSISLVGVDDSCQVDLAILYSLLQDGSDPADEEVNKTVCLMKISIEEHTRRDWQGR